MLIVLNKNPYLNNFKDRTSQVNSMSDKEILYFLRSNPIELFDNSVTSGKHRAFAMIGRLLADRPYIKVRAFVLV